VKKKVILDKLDEEGFTSLYVFTFEGESDSEYEKFFNKYESNTNEKIMWAFDVIEQRINKIVELGATDDHFRPEGKGAKALPVETSILRLYCYRIDIGILILGNGGEKPKNKDPNKNKTENFPELHFYDKTIKAVGLELKRQLKNGTITKKGNNLIGLKPFEIIIPDEKEF
jgi:hypothetical protein